MRARWHQRGNGSLRFSRRHGLQKQLFVWFVITLLMSAVVGGAVVATISRGLRGDTPHVETMSRWISRPFEVHWHDAERRTELLAEASEDFGFDIRAFDASGQQVFESGRTCAWPWKVPILVNGADAGRIEMCRRSRMFNPTNVLGILGALVAVWFASRALARKLGGPIIRLATSVSDIAEKAVGSDSIRPENYRGELRELAQTVKDMAHALETRVASQKRILAAVSHELRTPLSRLKVISELLNTGRDVKGHLGSMDDEINELELLVSQLIDSSRLEFKALNWSEENASRLLLASAKAVGLEANIAASPTEPLMIRVDAMLLRRALINVMRNALIHGAAPIELHLGQKEQEAYFDVIDSKGTLSASRFEAAVRGENVGDAKADGLGLGLHLAAGIAQALGGRLELVDSGPLKTCVRLWVPLAATAP